ncbi:MAG: hypothetical protein AB1847_14300 [bacterium]
MRETVKPILIAASLFLFFLTMPLGKALHQPYLAWGIEEIEKVEVDIEPGFCPNPLEAGSKGTFQVAILGTVQMDVTSIDPGSIRLEGVSPTGYRKEDVSTPIADRQDICDCTIEEGDGIDDLVFDFDCSKILSTMGDIGEGDVAVLTITGELRDGTPIEGEDCIVIQKPCDRNMNKE